MAISKNLYTRGLKQRLAGAVWFQNKGQTLVRELAASVSNPQTDAQMRQRIKLSNLVAMYRANKGWMNKYSFESKKNVWSDYNAFVSANLNNNIIYLTKEQVQAGAGVVYPYVMTKGTLPSVSVRKQADAFMTDLWTGDLAIAEGDTTTTVAQFTAALLENNNGLREGDQLSFIWNIQQTAADGTPFITGRYEEIILDLSDTTSIADRVGESTIITSDENDAATNALCFMLQGQNIVQGGCCVISRSVSGSIKVSSQSMVLSDDSYYLNYTGTTAQRRAIRSYSSSVSEPFLVPTYQGGGTIDAPTNITILGASDEDDDTMTAGDGTNQLPINADFSYDIWLSAPLPDTAIISSPVMIGRDVSENSNVLPDVINVTISEDRTKVNLTATTIGALEDADYIVTLGFTLNGSPLTASFTTPGGDVTE